MCLVAVVDGAVRSGDKVASIATGATHEVAECGVLAPEPHATGELRTGQARRRCSLSLRAVLAEP